MKKLLFILALCSCVVLSGCKKEETPVSSDTTNSSVSQEITSDVNTEPTAYIENLEGVLDTAPVLGEDSDYAAHLVFKTDTDVKNFCFFKVDMTWDENTNSLIGNPVKEFGFMDSLKANEEVLLIGETGEILPTLAVSFDSVDGTVYYFAIEISGEDGHAFLTEFTLAD